MRRRAVVTGAGGRVGQEIAIELARHGFDLGLHYRTSEEGVQQTRAACEALGAACWVVAADLASSDACVRLCAAVRERWDGLELLVNNASLFEPTPFEEISLAAWSRMMNVNLRAPFLLSQGLYPLLSRGRSTQGGQAGEGGLVVQLCDIGADRPVAGYAHYSVSKAGLVMLVKAMAVELAPAVRCLGVSPGQVIWPDDYSDDKRARLAKRIPMKRVGTPADIARLVRFMAVEAPYMNGEVVAVDGGLAARY